VIDVIGELTGKVAGLRIIHRHHPGELKVERTIESKGKIPGTEVTFIATIKSWERPHGGIYAGGDGVMMTMNGDTVMLQGSGISVAGKGAGLNMRGARSRPDCIPLPQQAQQCWPGVRARDHAGWNGP